MAFLSMGPISSSPISAIPGARVPQNLTLNLDDTVGTSDLVSAVGAGSFTFNDPVTVTDDFVRVVTYQRSPADSAPAVDALTKEFARVRALADSVGATDALTTALVRELALTDLVSASDAPTFAQHYGRTFHDFVVAEDELGMAIGLKLDDEVEATDDTSLVPLRFITEFVTATDAISINLTRTSVHLTSEPDLSYVADVAVDHRYRLDAAASSSLFIDSVEEYSPEETRSLAHATE